MGPADPVECSNTDHKPHDSAVSWFERSRH